MMSKPVKLSAKLLFWAYVFAGVTGLFCRFGGVDAQASADRQTPVLLLTETGVVACSMAEYLPYAVAAEMPASFGAEALKAQAVAARTYVIGANRHESAHVCTQSGCCLAYVDEPTLRALWGGAFEDNWQAVLQAVAATDGEYLTYGGQAIQAAFHASSLGFTENSGNLWSPLPYLVSVETPEQPGDVPELVTTVSVSAGDFAAALGLAAQDAPDTWLGETMLDDAGRVDFVIICGQAVSGGELRQYFGLRSTDFTLAWDGEAFLFTVNGYGHGVGMSQYGARAYAAQGWSYRDILAHYYPGTVLALWAPDSVL